MNTRTLCIAIALALALGEDASASEEPPSRSWPTPPFDAWVAVDDVYVMPSLGRYWPSVAILRYGDVVRVTGCSPSCGATDGWASLSPFGAVRLANLRTSPRDRRGEFLAGEPDFVWAKALRGDVVARAAPSDDARIVERFARDDELVFRHDPALLARGYLERPAGGFVSVASVRIFHASSFHGWIDPPERFVFVRSADAELARDDGSVGVVHRYDRFPLLGLSPGRVLVPGGSLARSAVRVGGSVARPSRIPAGARWTHVDLEEQVLTAYEGERLAFATLVSTGRGSHATRAGLFEVRRKITYTHMRGGGRDPYSVEGVPYVLYFDGAIALHGAYWHDGFGARRSHGCVNLAPADARFLFDFAPPSLPAGWRSVNPPALGLDTLWVVTAEADGPRASFL